MTSSQLDHILNEIISRLDRLEKTVANLNPRQLDRIWSEIQTLHAKVKRWQKQNK